jgi:hypothetical protein
MSTSSTRKKGIRQGGAGYRGQPAVSIVEVVEQITKISRIRDNGGCGSLRSEQVINLRDVCLVE